MDYVYGIVWLLVAVLLIFKMSKEHKIFIFLGFFFVVMAVWWVLNGIKPEWEMLKGTMSWVLRLIGAIVLSITIYVYYKDIRNKD